MAETKKKVVIFAPHPDDETLACGGTIIKKIAEGYNVQIVLMTDGGNAFTELFGISSDPSPHELKEIRREEFRRATRILGVKEENLFFMDAEDGRLEEDEILPEKVFEILDVVSPNEVFFPDKKDVNKDHIATNKIVEDSIKKLNLDLLGNRYVVWPSYFRLNPLLNRMHKFFKEDFVSVDITQYLHLKKIAINEYKSQITIISSRQNRPVLDISTRKRFLSKHELFSTKIY